MDRKEIIVKFTNLHKVGRSVQNLWYGRGWVYSFSNGISAIWNSSFDKVTGSLKIGIQTIF